LALLLLILWGLALSQYLVAPADARSWAGWALLIGAPALWALKAAALVLNPAGRAAVLGIASAAVWRRIGIARLPIPFILIVLTSLA
jgi:hypothetical protein